MKNIVDSVQEWLEDHWSITSPTRLTTDETDGLVWKKYSFDSNPIKPTINIKKGPYNEKKYGGVAGRTYEKQEIWIIPSAPSGTDIFDSDCQKMQDAIKYIVENHPLDAEDIDLIHYPGGRAPRGDRVGYPHRAYEVDIICERERSIGPVS